MMAEPTGLCAGQPCWTDADIQQLEAEIENAENEAEDADNAVLAAQEVAEMKHQTVMSLQMALSLAQSNRCANCGQ